MLLTTGICTADYSVNRLMTEGSGIKIVGFKDFGTYVEFEVMNQKLFINTEYINRDLERLRNELGKVLGS